VLAGQRAGVAETTATYLQQPKQALPSAAPPRPEPVSAIYAAPPGVPQGLQHPRHEPPARPGSRRHRRPGPAGGWASQQPSPALPPPAHAMLLQRARQHDATRDPWIGAGAAGERPDGPVVHPTQRRPASDGGLARSCRASGPEAGWWSGHDATLPGPWDPVRPEEDAGFLPRRDGSGQPRCYGAAEAGTSGRERVGTTCWNCRA
jgi:hypothetical protein